MPDHMRIAPDQIDPRPLVMKEYTNNQVRHLQLLYPDIDVAVLEDIVKEDAEKSLRRPTGTIITYPEPGECDLRQIDLLTFITTHRGDVITPIGTIFKSDPKHPPSSVKYCDNCNKSRTHFKKLMFACMEKGDKDGEIRNDKRQALKKIKSNSIIGAHGFKGSAFYDKECFSGVTSLGRNGVIASYGITEQCLVNNFYWNDPEKVINHVITVAAAANQEYVKTICEKFNLYIPDPVTAAGRLLESAKYYLSPATRKQLMADLVKLMEQLTPEQRTYIFYRRSMINMFVYNSEFFKEKIAGLFTLDKVLEARSDYQELLEATDPKSATSLPEDVQMMLSVVYNHVLNYKAVNRELVSDNPDMAKRFGLIGKAAMEYLEEFEEVYLPFMYSGEILNRVLENKYIIRKSVAISDTDSVIFTMKAPVAWFRSGDLSVTQESLNMSAYTVYMLSRVLNTANRDLAIAKGVVTEENVKRINLKSEFLYPVLVKTDLGKHYFAKYIAKEGRMLKTPKLDVKGVEFQSSTLPAVTQEFTKSILHKIIDDVIKYGNLYENDFIQVCLDYEKKILKSLHSGELGYYANASVKDKAQYKQPERSIYFNYELWQDVYAAQYGDLHLPGKYVMVPFQEKVMRSPQYLKWLENGYPSIFERYMRFLNKTNPKKKITRIVLPATCIKLPEIFVPAVNTRAIIYKNMAPAQLALKQIGINLGRAKQMPLFLDMYSDLTDASLPMIE